MTIRVSGALSADAQKMHALTGEAVVVVRVSPGYGQDFEARVSLGKDPAAHIKAEALALSCVKGMTADVEALAAEPRNDHGAACIVLRKLNRVVVAGRALL